MSKIRIMADNGCDLDLELLDRLGVEIFHMPVTIDQVTYRDRLDLLPPEFFRMLKEARTLPATAQITPAVFGMRFQEIMQQSDDDIIYIAFSSGLSGTFQSACMAGSEINPERITVIDSKSASVGYGLTVIRAAEAVCSGKSKEEVLEAINDNIARIRHEFVVGDFEMLKRGGRVSATTAALGNLMNVKLILHFVDGRIVPREKIHGMKKARKRLLDIMDERGYELENHLIGINYSVDYEGARELRDLIRERWGCQRFVISEIGAAIGAYVGAGTHSVFYLGPPPPNA